MKKACLALVLLAGCGGGDETANQSNQAAPAVVAKAGSSQLASLTGLYEGGSAETPNRICIVEGQRGTPQFGIVVWGGNLSSCSGSGSVTREGDVLKLAMAGDQTCIIEARIEGTTIKLDDEVPQGCSYYCGARATLGGTSFVQKGTTAADAAKATDLVGDPLCAGTGL